MSAVLAQPHSAPCRSAARVYHRRRPKRTALYRQVQQHLETWLARRREGDPDVGSIPCHVERELRTYLECGILARGFIRARCGDCGHNFLVAFSCKGRGLCPSCTTRRMAATAAHPIEHGFPRVPVRQWVISFPRRLRYILHRDPVLLGRVRRCVLRTIETGLRRLCPDAPRHSRFGAVSFVQRFGSALNARSHLHCCITDGVFSIAPDGTLRFHSATDLDAAAVSAVQRRMRSRVLRLAVRRGSFTPEVAADLARWYHGAGLSLHAAVRVEAEDRAGLERLLRYCAHPASAGARLFWSGSDPPVRQALPEPPPTGQTEITLTPLELRDRRAALLPQPRRHRHHHAGGCVPHTNRRARIDALRPLAGPRCQGKMRPIAFPTEPTTPPPLASRARAPPQCETAGPGTAEFAFDPSPPGDLTTPAPDPGLAFDQTLNRSDAHQRDPTPAAARVAVPPECQQHSRTPPHHAPAPGRRRTPPAHAPARLARNGKRIMSFLSPARAAAAPSSISGRRSFMSWSADSTDARRIHACAVSRATSRLLSASSAPARSTSADARSRSRRRFSRRGNSCIRPTPRIVMKSAVVDQASGPSMGDAQRRP